MPLTNAGKVDKMRLREEIKEKVRKEGKIQFYDRANDSERSKKLVDDIGEIDTR
jgi:hypothetical protein